MLLSAPLPIRRRAAKKILASLGAREITAEKVEAFLDFAAKEGGTFRFAPVTRLNMIFGKLQ